MKPRHHNPRSASPRRKTVYLRSDIEAALTPYLGRVEIDSTPLDLRVDEHAKSIRRPIIHLMVDQPAGKIVGTW